MTTIASKLDTTIKTTVDDFTLAYITAALWSTNDNSDPQGGNPLDDNYGPQDIHPDTLAKMVADCKKFQADNADLMTDETLLMANPEHTVEEYAGHDFWLTRNGHGCGFWDGDWEESAGEKLTAAAKAFRECHLEVGDDNLIHG